MTPSAEALAEAEKVLAAFQAALVRLGIKAIVESLKAWAKMPANKAVEQSDAWLIDAVRLVMTDRARSRQLAVAYYRLARALRTGTTIPDPYDPIPRAVTLGQLRREFDLLAQSIDQPPVSAPGPVTEAPPNSDTPTAPEPRAGDDTAIPIEEIDGFTDEGDSEAAKLERDAEEEARLVLVALGPNALRRRVAGIDHTRPASEVDQLRDEAHAKVGSRQASATDRMVKNGARDTVSSLAERDKRVIGYVRVSQTGTPCGFCAMLISRGVIFYSSESSATFRADGKKYHDNCNCIAVPVYSKSEYENSPKFALNREYSTLWPQVTKGLSGKAALSAWRRYFRLTQKNGDSDTGTALAA